jgi:hypothetical protein
LFIIINFDRVVFCPKNCHTSATKLQRNLFGISRTEFWWQSRDNLHIFEAEELADNFLPDDEISYTNFACRYVHSIVEEDTGKIIHFDGAVRMYSDEQMLTRLDSDIAKFGRHSVYTKLWRIDGTIPINVWKSLLADFYKDNPLIGEYLGGTGEETGLTLEAGKREANDFSENLNLETQVQDSSFRTLQPGTGVKVTLSYHPLQTYDFERVLKPLETLISREKQIVAFDAEAIELRKILLREGGDLTIPLEIELVSWRDHLVNFPLIVHGKQDLANRLKQTNNALGSLIREWRKRDFLNVCYSIGFPVEDREVRITVAGHVDDLEKWLNQSLSIPPTNIEAIEKWSDLVATYLATNFSHSIDKFLFSKMLTFSGKMWLPREILHVPFEHTYLPEEHNIELSIPFSSKEEAMFFAQKQSTGFTPALAYLIEACRIQEGKVLNSGLE